MIEDDKLGVSGKQLKKTLNSILRRNDFDDQELKIPTAKRSEVKRQIRREQHNIGIHDWFNKPLTEINSEEEQEQMRDEVHTLRSALTQYNGNIQAMYEKDPKNLLSTYKNQKLSRNERTNIQKVNNVLKFIYDEFATQGTELVKPSGLFYRWELEELGKNTRDTNLGDFIMKLPNPDLLPDEVKDLYPNISSEEGNHYMDFEEALQLYNDIFSIEDSANIHAAEIQKKAFSLVFMLLNLKERFQQKLIEAQAAFIENFSIRFSFLKKMMKIDLVQYLQIKNSPEQVSYESSLPLDLQNLIQKMMDEMGEIDEQNFPQAQRTYSFFRLEIYQLLQKQVQSCLGDLNGLKLTTLLIKMPQITEIFEYFPNILKALITESLQPPEDTVRKLCNGQYLQKKIVNEQLVWYISNRRPQDILTMIRKFLLFKLTQKAKIFPRIFLSQTQKQFFLVLKSSQQVLEEYSQNSRISLQVELGSTDIFSFEPVDKYLRPLRVHPYIRDRGFIKKYDLDNNKGDKDEELEGQKSIQAEALGFLRKAQAMNSDQLHAKIILDQQQADKSIDWLSIKLGVAYIKADDVIFNSYNDEQIDRSVWEIYYVYNKFLLEYVKRLKQIFKDGDQKSQYAKVVQNNLGLLLRLMMLKALDMCNDLHYNQREIRGIMPRGFYNLFKSRKVFKNIWDDLGVDVPKGFWPYIKIHKLERMWKKYEVNELKNRSKFFPAQRLVITNNIIKKVVNINKAQSLSILLNYYPIHDPFLLKNIKLSPYLGVIKKMILQERKNEEKGDRFTESVNSLFEQYESSYTKLDFTKQSIEQKLEINFGKITNISIDTIRFYCGTKIAMYFSYIRFLSLQAFPLILIAMIVQIVYWVEIGQIFETGESQFDQAVDIITVIFTFINILWITKMVDDWRNEEKKLAQEYGMVMKNDENSSAKRIQFIGSFKRNFENDEMNYQYLATWKQILQSGFSFLINLIFVVVMGLTIVQILILKTYLYQSGVDQTMVNTGISILIAVAIKIFNFLYTKLIGTILEFQNHKTVSDYESSLVSKSYIITFIVTFYAIIVYGFFATYIEADYLCAITLATGSRKIYCSYFMVSQLQSYVLVDFVMTIVGALTPYLTFVIMGWLRGKPKHDAQFNVNNFEAIDEFYEEQDYMSTYMYNYELDNTWLGYIKFISLFSVLALFGNILPLAYLMMYLTGAIGLHAGKYEIIYLSKRTIPVNRGGTSLWLSIMEVVSILGILSNLAYIVYARDIFTENKGAIFFFIFVFFLIFKYMLRLSYEESQSKMSLRNHIKTTSLISDKGLDCSQNKPTNLEPDISNVTYDEERLQRKFPRFTGANLLIKKGKGAY